MKDADGKVDYTLGWWLIGILIVGIYSLAFYFSSCTPASALPGKTFSTEATIIFEEKIKPYIQTKFGENISDEYLIVQRKLLKAELYKHEFIDGRDVYSVHIKFMVRITDRDSGFEHTTIRGQESLFLVKGNKIENIIPFDEYVIETDEGEIQRKLVTEDTEKKIED